MNKIKYLMALIAVCIIIAPALSTSYKEWYKMDKIVVIIPDVKPMDDKFTKSMMGPNDKQQMGNCPKAEMGSECKHMKSMMGSDDKKQMGNCPKAEMRSECKHMKSMMGSDVNQQMVNCPKAEMGSECKHMKSMMG
ncbi:MAG: hypothetical protein LUQ47_02565, partial [Methanotrichaceae archaeon]|nr:hypothetical protein [Methanotrichaceae archaeon]